MNKNIILPGGAKMPVVGLGTWQCIEPEKLENAMDAAFQIGYRHFDTAYAYSNEEIVGKVIQKWINKGLVKREELFVTTKLPLAGVHPDRVEMFLDESLKNLGLDYVDLYLIHFPVCMKNVRGQPFPVDEAGVLLTEPTDHVAVWKKMEAQVASGKTKHIGLSNFTKTQISKILKEAKIKPANLQVEVNLYYQNNELVDFCKEQGISIVAYSPLGCPAINEFNEKRNLPIKEIPKMLLDEKLQSIAKKHSKSPAQVILRYLLQRDLAIIPKSVTPSRIKENIDIFDFELDTEDCNTLKSLNRGNAAKICDLRGMKGLVDHPEFPFK